jgi:hypothetical protein
MRIACWVPKSTQHSQTLLAFPLQQWLPVRASMSRSTYITGLVIVVDVDEAVNITIFHCRNGNSTMGSLCTVVELQNVRAVFNNNKYLTLSVCVRILALFIRHANRIFPALYSAICDLPSATKFSHISQTAQKAKLCTAVRIV